MGLPVSQTHPAEVVFAVVTLHMIAASILLNTDVTTRTLKSKPKIVITECTLIMQPLLKRTSCIVNIGNGTFRLQPSLFQIYKKISVSHIKTKL
jgi:hypothetical protein